MAANSQEVNRAFQAAESGLELAFNDANSFSINNTELNPYTGAVTDFGDYDADGITWTSPQYSEFMNAGSWLTLPPQLHSPANCSKTSKVWVSDNRSGVAACPAAKRPSYPLRLFQSVFDLFNDERKLLVRLLHSSESVLDRRICVGARRGI